MGADNWSHCPICVENAEAVLDNLERRVDDMYGKVSLEDFDSARESLARERAKMENFPCTFREDYRISGSETGIVHVKYEGNCTVCKLKFEFEEDHKIPGASRG